MASVSFYQNQPHRLRVAMRLVGWIAVSLLIIPVAIEFAIAAVPGIFGWMNRRKGISCNWAGDTQHFLWLQRRRFTQYWGQHIAIFTIKITEPAYYFIAYVIAKLTGGNILAFAWVVSLWIYIPLGVPLAAMIKTSFSSGRFGFIIIRLKRGRP